MGRRARGPVLDGTEPVEGVETEGKLFFEKPILTLVGKAVEEPRSTYFRPQAPTEDLKALKGKVRLKSSRNYQICPNPPEVEYELSQAPTYDEITRYLHKMRVAGFGTGAVVTRRYQGEWRFKSVHQWGVITFEVSHLSSGMPFAPYNVVWFEKTTADGGQERAWAEDLVIIHSHMTSQYIEEILESQGIEFRGK